MIAKILVNWFLKNFRKEWKTLNCQGTGIGIFKRLYVKLMMLLRKKKTRLSYLMKNYADRGEFYPPSPNIVLGLRYSSFYTQPHSIIVLKQMLDLYNHDILTAPSIS